MASMDHEPTDIRGTETRKIRIDAITSNSL
jgi:hypothetical protein